MPNFETVRREILKKEPPSVFLDDDKDVTCIPFGVFTLDYLTGGGVPESRVSIFWGDKSTSKTTSAYRIANNYLRMNPKMKVIFVDFEGTFDKKWAANFIDNFESVFNKRFIVVCPDYGEHGIDLIKEISKADDVGLIIVDSVAMMVPLGEFQKSAMDNVQPGSLPRLMNSMFRKLIPIVAAARKNKRKLTILLINQIQVVIGKTSFGIPVEKPGGRKQGLLATLEIRFFGGKYHKIKEVPYKVTHIFKIEKNKLGLTDRKGRYTMYLVPFEGNKVGAIDEADTVIHYARETGVLQREGNKWKWKDMEFANRVEVRELMNKDRKSWINMRRETLRALWDINPLNVSQEPQEQKAGEEKE